MSVSNQTEDDGWLGLDPSATTSLGVGIAVCNVSLGDTAREPEPEGCGDAKREAEPGRTDADRRGDPHPSKAEGDERDVDEALRHQDETS